MGWRPGRRCRFDLERLAHRDVAAGAGADRRPDLARGDHRLGDPARHLARAAADAACAARTAPGAGPPRHHAGPAGDRARRQRRGAQACGNRQAPDRRRSAGVAAACAGGPDARRPHRRATRLPRHGAAQGYAAAGPARIVHRGAARRRCRGRRRHRRGGAEAVAGGAVGVACGARLPLRPGRLGGRAVDSRQQSRRRPDRQGAVSPPARGAADRAGAGAGGHRARPGAPQRAGSGAPGADAGAGGGAGRQIAERGTPGPPRHADRRSRMGGESASRSGRRLCPCEARRLGAAAAGTGRAARDEGAGTSGERAGGGARGDRCQRIRPGARGAGAVPCRADAARRHDDGGAGAHRAWRQRPGAGMDPARGARAARSGVDRRRLCVGSLAAGVAGHRPARRLPVARAAGGAAVRQGRGGGA